MLAERVLRKRELIATRRDQVTQVIHDPDGTVEDASAELRDLLTEHLLGHSPDLFREIATVPVRRVEVVEAHVVDFGDGSHPIEQAGLLCETDWCLLLPDGSGALVLAAASVCFPTRWVLADKLGKSVAAVHDPVSAYGSRLAGPVDRFMDRLGVGRPAWRLNWNLVDHPDLFQPTAGDPPEPPVTGADAGERVWLRVERQTFVRLPRSRAVVFGIEVHIDPLESILGVPGAAARLQSALANLPERTVAEKGLGRIMDPVGAWLSAREA